MPPQRFNLPDGRYMFIEHRDEQSGDNKVVNYTEVAVYSPDDGIEIAVRGRQRRLLPNARQIIREVFGLSENDKQEQLLLNEIVKALRVDLSEDDVDLVDFPTAAAVAEHLRRIGLPGDCDSLARNIRALPAETVCLRVEVRHPLQVRVLARVGIERHLFTGAGVTVESLWANFHGPVEERRE